MRKTRDLFKEIVVTKGTFPVKMGKIKNRNGKDLPKQKGLIKSGKNTWENYKKNFNELCNHDNLSPRDIHP